MRARFLSDSDIPSLARLRQLRILDFGGGSAVGEAPVTDIGLERLSKLDLPRLEWLTLGYCDNITDVGLAYVGQMHTVRWLSLMVCPRITDAGLPSLLGMKSLTSLDLRGCPGITDRGLEHLIQKNDWQVIMLGGCPNVTNEAVARLQAALPNTLVKKDEDEWSCHVDHGDVERYENRKLFYCALCRVSFDKGTPEQVIHKDHDSFPNVTMKLAPERAR